VETEARLQRTKEGAHGKALKRMKTKDILGRYNRAKKKDKAL
jgi:hypothetical protein